MIANAVRRVEEFRGIHDGGRLLILGNGPSCKLYGLDALPFPIIGLNQAWKLVECAYYCMGDQPQYQWLEGARNIHRKTFRGTIFTEQNGPNYAVKLNAFSWDPEFPKRFSFDLTKGIYLNNTIASFGFQLAVWMLGLRGTIYTLGIDCDGLQFGGDAYPVQKFMNIRETLGYIAGFLTATRPGIEIYDLSPVSKQRVFERKKFEEVFG